MKIATIGLLFLLTGCWAVAYPASNLNRVQPGWTRDQFLNYWAQGKGKQPILRASKAAPGDTIAVYTMPFRDGAMASDIEYWFLFKNSRLVQWGQPADWRQVAATYQIDFNPGPAVRPPG